MKTTTIINSKDGTAALLIANFYATTQKKNVLAVDINPEANFTYAIGAEGGNTSFFNMDKGQISVLLDIRTNIDLIPADEKLTDEQAKQSNTVKEGLKRFSGGYYDECIIDAPADGFITLNALIASDKVIICVNDAEAVLLTADHIDRIKLINNDLTIIGAIIGGGNTDEQEQIKSALSRVNIPILGTINNDDMPEITLREELLK